MQTRKASPAGSRSISTFSFHVRNRPKKERSISSERGRCEGRSDSEEPSTAHRSIIISTGDFRRCSWAASVFKRQKKRQLFRVLTDKGTMKMPLFSWCFLLTLVGGLCACNDSSMLNGRSRHAIWSRSNPLFEMKLKHEIATGVL